MTGVEEVLRSGVEKKGKRIKDGRVDTNLGTRGRPGFSVKLVCT